MKALILGIVGSGITIGVVRALATHHTTKFLNRKKGPDA